MAKDEIYYEKFKDIKEDLNYSLEENVRVDINIDGIASWCNGEGLLMLAPNASIIIKCENPENFDFQKIQEGKYSDINLTIDKQEIKGYIYRIFPDKNMIYFTTNDMPRNFIDDNPKSVFVNVFGEKAKNISYVTFGLFNFLDIDKNVGLKGGKWKVSINSFGSTKSNIEKLRTSARYALTHVGTIEKINNEDFAEGELRSCLGALRLFLSFARGGWCIPICPTGFDADDEVVWKSWSSPQEEWPGPFRWLSDNSGEKLEDFFEHFMEKRKGGKHRAALDEAISLYIQANNCAHLNAKAGIVLAQSAFERLAYQVLVNEGSLSEKEFRWDVKVIEKLEDLFEKLGIPKDAPKSLRDRIGWTKWEGWEDFPNSIKAVRDSIAHYEEDDDKEVEKIMQSYHDVWHMSMWYLERCIFAICGYDPGDNNEFKDEWLEDSKNPRWVRT